MNKNWNIVVQDNSLETGGYYVLIWCERKNIGYDDWFDNYDTMKHYIDNEYSIEWSDKNYIEVNSNSTKQ